MSGLYSIEAFSTERGLGMGHYGPSIVLAQEVVAAVLEVKLPNNTLPETILNLIRKSVPRSMSAPQAVFYNDTALLRYLTVGGDCACLGIEGNDLAHIGSEDVRYSPHNIDCPEDSAVALSAWLCWFNIVIWQTSIRPPYSM